MAKCPKCGATQDWWKLLLFDRTQLLVCWVCGSTLSMDSERGFIWLGTFIVILLLPQVNILPFDGGVLWFIGVAAIYIPFYLRYMKLNIIIEGELDIVPEQEIEFVIYAKERRKLNFVGYGFLWGGVLIFLGGLSLSSIQINEVVSVVGLVLMTVGFGMLAITRCPFCKNVTVRNPLNNTGRCINCHRDIDVDQ